MPAAFKFDKFQLIELIYKPNIQTDVSTAENSGENGNNNKVAINITAKTIPSTEDNNKYRMELTVKISGRFEAIIGLYGFFSGTGFYDNNDTEREELNGIGVALLLPIARSILASVTAQDGSTPFLIPPVNITEMTVQETGNDTNENE